MALPKHVDEKRQALAEKVIGDIQSGKPFFWNSGHIGGPPKNAVTGKRYRGGNAVTLYVTSLDRGYIDPRWMTFEQAKSQGHKVKKGEKGTHIEFWTDKKLTKERNPETGMEEKKVEKLEHPIVKNYVVFNAAQIEGLELEAPRIHSEAEKNTYMENMIKNSEAKLFEDQVARNFYRPSKDEIHLMPRESFHTLDNYYAVAAHEIAHSTGAKDRLDRPMVGGFGTPEYAKEELRAEMASMFLHEEYGLKFDESHYKNHTAYLQNWAETIKKNPNELYQAAADAQRICDYVEERMILKDLVQEKVTENNVEKTAEKVEAIAPEKATEKSAKKTKAKAKTVATEKAAEQQKEPVKKRTKRSLTVAPKAKDQNKELSR